MGASLTTGKKVKWGSFSLKIKKSLGEGGFGYVYLVKDKPTGKKYALKRVLCQDEQALQVSRREAELMRLLGKHPHVVQLVDSYEHDVADGGRSLGTEVYLLMELCSGGCLADLIKQRAGKPLPEKQMWSTFLDVVLGVSALHSLPQPVSHRDIKAENVLLGDDGHYKLCDFGSASLCNRVLVDKRDIAMEEENIQRFTTLMYRAPEMADVHSRMLIGPPADMWALGCLLYTLCYGTHPFASATQLQIVNANVRYPQAAPGGQPVNPVALAILQALLQQQLKVVVEHAIAGGTAATLPPLTNAAARDSSSAPLTASPHSTTTAEPRCSPPFQPPSAPPPPSSPPFFQSPSPTQSPARDAVCPGPSATPVQQAPLGDWAHFDTTVDLPPPLPQQQQSPRSRSLNKSSVIASGVVIPTGTDRDGWFASAKARSLQRQRSEDKCAASSVERIVASVDALEASDEFGQQDAAFGNSCAFQQSSVLQHSASFAASESTPPIVHGNLFASGDGFGSADGFGADDGFGHNCVEQAPESAHIGLAASDKLASFRGKSLKVKRSSGVVECGWQLAAGAQIDGFGMVELVMGDLSRGMSVDELFQLNAELLPPPLSLEQSAQSLDAAQSGLGKGFGANDEVAASDELGAVSALLPPILLNPDSASDILSPFRNKFLNVKRSSGDIEAGWMLEPGAQLNINGMVDVVKENLMRSVSLDELKTLNRDIVRVALGELTPEEILAGLSMGKDVFQSGIQ